LPCPDVANANQARTVAYGGGVADDAVQQLFGVPDLDVGGGLAVGEKC
jgi:hypothetical protein